ncbi:MAG: hypothetical protein IPL84_14930 [Chitinophagaceae bacterium]|nr:hypothetical protein [Chitinophagaceae bacterium]
MIEQTEMIVTKWYFHLSNIGNTPGRLSNSTTMEVMKKRNAIKKGIACRLSCRFLDNGEPILDYVAEHSYVIDFDETINRNELLRMFRNSFENFEEKFELRKLGTMLQHERLRPLDETVIDVDNILPLLV